MAFEYPIGPTSGTEKGPARIIILIKNRWSIFMGFIAHDTTRRRGTFGYMDHFQIRPAVRLEAEEEEERQRAYDRFAVLSDTFMDPDVRQGHNVGTQRYRHTVMMHLRLLGMRLKLLQAIMRFLKG